MLIYGTNPIKEAMRANRKIYELFCTSKTDAGIVKEAKKKQIKVTTLKPQDLERKFGKTHQHVGANVEDYHTLSLAEAIAKEGKKLFIMLDGVTDPHNLGAVIRNVEAFGASGIIIPKHRSATINATVVKVSSGAIEYVDIVQVTNLNQAIKSLKENNIWVVGTDLDARDTLDDVFVDLDLCVVFGSEGSGLSQLIKKNCDYLVKIPMQGYVNSLNVSVSTGVVLHDISKQKRG